MVELKGLYKVTAKGRAYYYAWRNGPRITAAHGTPAFAAEFAAHHAGRKGGAPGRLSEVIVAWKRSEAWTAAPEAGGLALSTRKNWRGPLDDISAEFGEIGVAAFDDTKAARKRIKAWLKGWAATPRAADMRKQVLSALLSYAIEEDRLSQNPCFGIANAYEVDRSELVWDEEAIMRLAGAASPELMYALGLACLTGLRQSDLLRLSWSHVGDLAIEMRAGKSRVRGRGQRSVTVPMYAELRALLDAIPRRATTVLTNSDGLPWRSGFTSSWNKALKAVGEPELHFHDARGSFATIAYLALDAAGERVFSLAEIAQMLAWSEAKVERIIRRYVNRDALLRDKIRRMDEARGNVTGTSSAKPAAKPGRSN